ncbi:MAG: aryl-sulfate sulfotransferase [Gelidibacter sp.]
MKQKLLTALFLFFIFAINAQNTVGTITNTTNAFNGYTLFTSQTETYLINNCGEVIKQWTSNYPPGNSVYLLEDGSLLRACNIGNTAIAFGGTGGRIEKYDWDGNLIWSYNYSSSTMVQHHDIYPLPNGNILILAATIMTNAEAIQAGRNPSQLVDGDLFNEQVVELQPTGTNTANIVWEWNIKDHLIQDFDATKDNFGNVADNPQRLDINFLNGMSGINNWLHINSMQYNATLDQIVLSSRHMSEIYIIDHSTTTAQAATSTGGTYGKGGDFLYRWGNPQAYKQGTAADRKLYGQHYPHWIPDGLTDAGKLILFNNGFGRNPSYSEVFILTPPTDALGSYSYTTGTAYGPETPDYTYSNGTNFFSRILSSAQRLPNDNILICDGDSGYFFEIDSNENIVWEYINPASNDGILSQGDSPVDFANIVFRAYKYAPDYAAFTGRDLTPGNPIELNPDLSGCDNLGTTDFTLNTVKLYPNPTLNQISIASQKPIDAIEVYTVLGSKVTSIQNSKSISLQSLKAGVYVVKIYSGTQKVTKKIIKL